MLIKTLVLVASTALAAFAPSIADAQASMGGIPMTGTTPMHPWFDWIFFAIVIPWFLLATWDLVNTR